MKRLRDRLDGSSTLHDLLKSHGRQATSKMLHSCVLAFAQAVLLETRSRGVHAPDDLSARSTRELQKAARVLRNPPPDVAPETADEAARRAQQAEVIVFMRVLAGETVRAQAAGRPWRPDTAIILGAEDALGHLRPAARREIAAALCEDMLGSRPSPSTVRNRIYEARRRESRRGGEPATEARPRITLAMRGAEDSPPED